METEDMNAVKALLAGLIDYAGLFPPASLEMPTVVRNFAAFREGEYARALGRFIVPANRLDEFEDAQRAYGLPFRLSVLTGSALTTEVRSNVANIEAIEFKAESARDISQAIEAMPAGIEAYFEIPVHRDPSAMIALLSEAGVRAKIRTGGTTADMFPTSSQVARFLECCARARVPFKATAGLHHPIRSIHRFTYEPDSPSGWMHGFLNVFLAAALVYHGGAEYDAIQTLDETSRDAFRFDESGVSWRSHRLTTHQLLRARGSIRSSSRSAGSCFSRFA